MFRALARIFPALLIVALTSSVDARPRRISTVINKKATRARVSRLVKSNRLFGAQLNARSLRAHKSVSATAAKKARQTEQGFNGFNGAGATSSVVRGARGSNWIVTQAGSPSGGFGLGGPTGLSQYFVVRDARSGKVEARGFVNNGEISWTRSHNERGKKTPSERNAAR